MRETHMVASLVNDAGAADIQLHMHTRAVRLRCVQLPQHRDLCQEGRVPAQQSYLSSMYWALCKKTANPQAEGNMRPSTYPY